MQELTVAEVRAGFSEILTEVQKGESFGVVYGRRRTPVAKIVPYDEPTEIKLGVLSDVGRIEVGSDWEMTSTEMLGQ
jgi:antitoxin (DNA-binding transcriptional repressor) of toxin-antitoxin stability system